MPGTRRTTGTTGKSAGGDSGTPVPPGRTWLIFVLLLSAPETRVQFLSMAALTAAIAVASALARRLRKG